MDISKNIRYVGLWYQTIAEYHFKRSFFSEDMFWAKDAVDVPLTSLVQPRGFF